MYYCYEGTFITTKERTPANRSASLPARLHQPTPDPDGVYVQTLEERAFALGMECVEAARIARGASAEPEEPSPVSAERNHGTDVPSVGSLGHPEFCHRPCLLLQFGCPNGLQCGYCHHPHGPRVKLDKQRRDTLRNLSEYDQLKLVLPHLKAQQLRLDLPGAARVVELMEQHLAGLEVPHGAAPKWKQNSLSRAIRDMSFIRLMQFCPCTNLDPIQSALMELRASYQEASTD
ncbi:unnamed protein product [Effrenium voratum]|nr:unnamed protein product [Effrenium voratum]